MDNDTVIKVEHLSKKYCKSLKRSMIYGIMDIGKNMLGRGSHPERLRKREFWALDDISFEVKKGETIGVIGPNGSGKTTMLKLLNGIFWPDKGKITIKGRVGALIEVGAGFHPLLTGRENIYINAAILGMTRKEVDKKLDSIIEFADIGNFIEMPVKFYSSGMFVRLGFATAIHSEPDVLLIDEVLAVGDLNFRMKCVEKIKELKRNRKTILYVSHEMTTVKKMCEKCIWLKEGHIEVLGDSHEVVDLCVDHMRTKNLEKGAAANTSVEGVEVIQVWTEDGEGHEKDAFDFGETIVLRVKYRLLRKIDDLIFGIALFTGDNICICALHTGLDGLKLSGRLGLNEIRIDYPSINLLSGTYYLDIGFFEAMAVAPFTYLHRACKVNVKSPFLADGLLVMEHKWHIH